MALDNNDPAKSLTEPAATEPNNQGTQQNPQPNSGDNNKTFTQDDVDRIVQERLARERKNNNNNEDLETREQNLTARENRLECAEKLQEKGLNKSLLDILDTSDVDKFMENVGKLESMGAVRGTGKPVPYIMRPTPGPLKDEEVKEEDAKIRNAFGL